MATTMTRVSCSSLASTSSAFASGRASDARRPGLPQGRFISRVSMRSGGAAAQISPDRNIRAALVVALTSQVAAISQRAAQSVAEEASKYFNSTRGDARNLEEALMTVPDLESIPYKVVRRENTYELRNVESYLIAETKLPGRSAFDFLGSGQGFNTLADYLFGKNTKKEAMEMTTPVVVQRGSSQGEKMDMTTPVLSQKGSKEGPWTMAFVLPSKYSEEDVPTPDNSAVKVRRVPAKTLAVTAFSGFVTDAIVKRRVEKLRKDLRRDPFLRVNEAAEPEVAQYNPPFTPPFARRNEVALEVELTSNY